MLFVILTTRAGVGPSAAAAAAVCDPHEKNSCQPRGAHARATAGPVARCAAKDRRREQAYGQQPASPVDVGHLHQRVSRFGFFAPRLPAPRRECHTFRAFFFSFYNIVFRRHCYKIRFFPPRSVGNRHFSDGQGTASDTNIHAPAYVYLPTGYKCSAFCFA